MSTNTNTNNNIRKEKREKISIWGEVSTLSVVAMAILAAVIIG